MLSVLYVGRTVLLGYASWISIKNKWWIFIPLFLPNCIELFQISDLISWQQYRIQIQSYFTKFNPRKFEDSGSNPT